MLIEEKLSVIELEVRLMELIKAAQSGAERGALALMLSELSHVGHPALIKAS